MKSSSASFFGVVVGMLSLVSAVLSITSENYGMAVLAIAAGGGAAALLFTVQSMAGHLEELRHDMESLRGDSNRSSSNSSNTSNSSLEASLKELKAEISKISKLSEPTSISLPAPSPSTQLSASNIGAPTTALSQPSIPAAAFSAPEPAPIPVAKKESYQYSAPASPTPTPSPSTSFGQQNFGQNSSSFSAPLDDPNRTNASFALPKPKSPITSANVPVSDTGNHDIMETTQSFLPHVPTGHTSEHNATNLSTDATIGFEASSLPSENSVSNYLEAPKPPSKTHSKIKKRYSTFAGLSLNEDTPEINKYREDVLTPPPPPPPPSKIEKKRYSTFAGLALGERSKISPPSSPSPSTIASPPPAKAGNPLSILSPSTVTNLGFSKNTDGMGVSRDELMAASTPTSPSVQPPMTPGPSSASAPVAPITKGTRKRYQTFMGLSLSKTPQPMKRIEEPVMDATAPLSVSGVAAAPSYAKAPAPSSLQAAINRGQQGNLVDGFCSLCGSPQAAANDYASTGSEPEFCWYCGAKLR